MIKPSFIILSAQPDVVYYEWQLEIQFVNLTELGFDLSNYHVLVGYRNAPSSAIVKLAERYPRVNWNFYLDTRKETRSYVSSIRPHIISKHFEEFPWLEGERLFYIDSDVIFRDLPPLWKLNNSEVWYFSHAEYVSIDKIKQKGDHILTDMCRIVGVDRKQVEFNGHVNGGAQSWINGVDKDFWKKMEIDSTRLHDYLKLSGPIAAKLWSKNTGNAVDQYKKMQEYLSDMWAILWNGILLGKQIRVEQPMLDFCRPGQTLDRWDSSYILHYSVMTGCEAPEYFVKSLFSNDVDLDWSAEKVLTNVCAVKYAEYVEKIILIRRNLQN